MAKRKDPWRQVEEMRAEFEQRDRRASRALRAVRAWLAAEDMGAKTSHSARMELCSAAQYLVRKALGDLDEGAVYEGVPFLAFLPGPYVDRVVPNEEEAWSLVEQMEELMAKEGDA